jgi:hypothetical protein
LYGKRDQKIVGDMGGSLSLVLQAWKGGGNLQVWKRRKGFAQGRQEVVSRFMLCRWLNLQALTLDEKEEKVEHVICSIVKAFLNVPALVGVMCVAYCLNLLYCSVRAYPSAPIVVSSERLCFAKLLSFAGQD